MKESIYERAVTSAFQYQFNKGVSEPRTQLKAIERRVRALSREDQKYTPSFESLIGVLTEGICVQLGNEQFVAQLTELQTEPIGGLVKKLSANVDKKTKNPKTSRGTVWRRNSTVKERRRISPNWKDGSAARTEAKRKSVVELIPYEVWLGEQKQAQSQTRQQSIAEVQGKRTKRSYKLELEREMQKRLEAQLSIEEVVATEFLKRVRELSEKNGIANEKEMYQRTLECLRNGQPLPILFVWGPPYEGQGENLRVFEDETPERIMAEQIEWVISELSNTGVSIQPILLFADSYGIEVNGMNEKNVQAYFNTLKLRFSDTAQVISWSSLRGENSQLYEEFAAELDFENLEVSEENIRNATLVQAKLGRNITAAEARSLALRYKRERLIEGRLLGEGFFLNGSRVENVVKLATAPSRFRNDEPYEKSLPRIYIKNMLRAAWNKPRR